MLKKLILAIAGLALTAPAFADRGHGHGHGYGHGYGHKHRVVVHERHVVHHPVYVRHYYRPAPRPVYVVRHAPPPPVVVHHHSNPHAGAALLVGAIVGASLAIAVKRACNSSQALADSPSGTRIGSA